VGRVVGEITREPWAATASALTRSCSSRLRQDLCELPVEVKNANSHRGKAAQQMLALMRERWFP
jgi:XTP/dITP diphosphohydrolase